tara:strand:- start:12124 stop:12912 length:789 start_codon:yes stop_codon:yes gene_type:complete
MKLLLENWRKHLNEQEKQLLGVYVDYEPGYNIKLAIADLGFIKSELSNAESIDDFTIKLFDKALYDKAVVGYIWAVYNPAMSKAAPSMGGSGGNCAGTWSVKRSIGRGYGKQLYDALLGFAAENDLYVTADRDDVSPGAQSRWNKIDAQTDDEVPDSTDPYKGTFDDWSNPETKPKDDDCIVHGIDSIDKGYKDQNTVDFYKELSYNLDSFFEKEIQPLFQEPGFFGKLFGQTPQNKAEKLKRKLLKLGAEKFRDFMPGVVA